MGAMGFGAGVRPPGAGRADVRRMRGIRGVTAGRGGPPGGGDIRGMRNVGGYSTVGLRAIPPIDWTPAPDCRDDAETEADALIDALLARADEALARADEVLEGTDDDACVDARTAASHERPEYSALPDYAGDELAGVGASR